MPSVISLRGRSKVSRYGSHSMFRRSFLGTANGASNSCGAATNSASNLSASRWKSRSPLRARPWTWRSMGCQHAQGYFISKSLPSEQVPQFFADWASLMKSDPIGEENALPKIAIIQALLSDILREDCEDDSTLVLSDLGNNANLDEDTTLQLARKIPALVLQGRVAAALARCQAALQRLEKRPDRVALKGKILQLRQLLAQDLICTDDLELFTADGPVRLLPRRVALIGRPSTAKAVDIPVGCRWFSRGEKNLRLCEEGEDWFVEDLGSANGSSIADRPLQ